MSEFLAEAQILITPNTANFRADLLKSLETIEKQAKVNVLVVPDMKGFQKTLREAVTKSSSGVVAKVKVVPDMTGFREALRKAAAKSAAGVTVPVAATVAPTPAAARPAAAPASTAAAAATTVAPGGKSPERQAEDELKAQRRVRREIEREFRAAEEERATSARRAANQRIAAFRAVESAQEEASRRAVRAGKDETRAFLKDEADRDKAARKAVRDAAVLEKQKTAARVAGVKERIAAIRTETKAELQRAAGTGVAAALKKREQLAGRAVRLADDLARVERAGARATNEVTAARLRATAATNVANRTEKLYADALKINDVSLQKQIASLNRNAAAKARNAVATATAGEAERKAARDRDFAARGFGAQTLQFAGLRGAVLSANSAFIAGTVAAVAFGKAIQGAATFESELNVFKVVAGATAVEMGRVRAEAERLGKDITLPGVSATDAAEAFQQLSKAGLSVEDSLDGARGVLQLATAAQISNAEATEFAASALNSFGLAGDQAVRVADVLANASNLAQGSISDVAIALQQASAVANQVGLSFEDTVTFLTQLQRAGIRGSDAGTSLRVALTRLIAPTDQAAGVLKELNIQVRDAAGNLRPDVFLQIANAQKELSRAQQDANAKIIFGVDALRAYSIISRDGAASAAEIEQALRRQGTAAEVANARMTGLTGAAENLKNQLSALGLTFGTVLLPPLTLVTEGLAIFVKDLNEGLQAIDKFAASAVSGFTHLSDVVAGIPQIKIGPLDTGDIDRFFGKVDEAVFGGFSGPKSEEARNQTDAIVQRIIELRAEADKFQSSGGFIPPRIINETRDLTEQLTKLGKAARESGSNNQLVAFLRQFERRSPAIRAAFLDGIITPSEEAALKLTALGRVFLKFVPKDAFIGIGAAARSGIEDGTIRVEGAVRNMGAHIRSGIEDASRDAVQAARRGGQDVGEAFADGLTASVRGLSGRLQGLTREALEIEVEGGPNVQQKLLENARSAEALARQKLATQRKRFANKDISEETLKAALQEVKDRKDERERIEEAIESDADQAERDAKSRAKEIQDARDEADKALIDAFTGRQSQFDARAFVADQDKTLKNDLAVERTRKKFLFSRIAFFRTRIKDEATLKKILETVREALRQTDAEIDAILKEQADNAEENRKNAREAITETLGKQLQLAQLKGGKDAILAAFDKAISDARQRVRQAKKLGLIRLNEQIALQQLINDRKDFLEQLKEDAEKQKEQGTTAFDLLQSAAETFRETGGNLIGGNQPFAGPTGFTADLAQFLRRQSPQASAVKIDTSDVPGRAIDRQINSLDALTEAVKENTRVQSGNAPAGKPRTGEATPSRGPVGLTAGTAPGSFGARWTARRYQWDSTQARKVVESRSGI